MAVMEAQKPKHKDKEGGQVTYSRIDHLTIRTLPGQLEEVREFYEKTLHLKPGKRPSFSFPGYWLYWGDHAMVHLAGNARADLKYSESGATLGFDHVSFRTKGLKAMRERLRKLNVKFEEVPVPGFPLHQIFFRDPVGMKVELTFDGAETKD
jgi:catechol 2,3-dioxygenase-like lactoylglutathione lyase family enzyme